MANQLLEHGQSSCPRIENADDMLWIQTVKKLNNREIINME